MECNLYMNKKTGEITPKIKLTNGEFLFLKKLIDEEGKVAIERFCEMTVAEDFIPLYAKALVKSCGKEADE